MHYVSRIFGCVLLAILAGCGEKVPPAMPEAPVTEAAPASAPAESLSDGQIEEIVRASYPYVAMYNVNNKFALKQGWNRCVADTVLKDHTMTDIARPNNDTLYITCLLDLRAEPVTLSVPAFESRYVSLMVTGYDHYVNIPLSVTKGDFGKPENVYFYTARTAGYDGAPLEGLDRGFEMTGDFVSAVFRVMPHASDPQRFSRILEQMQSVKAVGLAAFRGEPASEPDDPGFPSTGQTDADIYASNFPEVMQFAVNHTTFDTGNPVDEAVRDALRMIGVEPGKLYDPTAIHYYEGERFRAVAEQVRKTTFARMLDPASLATLLPKMFRTKGNIDADTLLFQSVIGPIGQPATEAVYPAILTEDGEPMNAMNDYVITMDKDQLPPARAFWSLTLYDSANGFFIPNAGKKYSVGENAGMKLDADGGIAIYIAAEQPEGVPEENWLPIARKDENLDVIMRIYDPDLGAFANYQVPVARKLVQN